MRHVTILLSALLSIFAAAFGPATAHAFCGFYVSGADASLYNNATMVVMMREGTRTVLSMQNNYQGPPEDFAMVVPVPVVLQKENVKTLPREIFDRVDQLAAPRLVEYWEQDPCYQERDDFDDLVAPMAEAESMAPRAAARAEDLGVTIEAQFKVAEYDIVILSARDSTGLDTWLRQEKYNIPAGAEPVLRPYVEKGTKFFVAKVDAERVSFEGGRAVLSPLRFHYDTDEFSLPVRLGLLNSAGQQDLIVHILANGQRYEAANYPNVAIPTNLVVVNAVRNEFGAFYDLLFRRTVAKNPGSVVTEYSWDASSCDPCPVTPLQPAELMTLGADVLHGDPEPEEDGPRGVLPRRPPRRPPPNLYGFVLTRLHYRYGKEGLEEDLVFRQGPPIVGGRGMPDQEGMLREEGATSGSRNNFQGRYVILHRWEGEIACQNPRRGLWGGPPGQGGGRLDRRGRDHLRRYLGRRRRPRPRHHCRPGRARPRHRPGPARRCARRCHLGQAHARPGPTALLRPHRRRLRKLRGHPPRSPPSPRRRGSPRPPRRPPPAPAPAPALVPRFIRRGPRSFRRVAARASSSAGRRLSPVVERMLYLQYEFYRIYD